MSELTVSKKKFACEFTIFQLPKMPNQMLGSHWRTRAGNAVKWRKWVWLTTLDQRPDAPLKKARLTLTRFSSIRPDFDGLAGSFKAVLDALTKAKIIDDDSHEVIGQPEYLWERAKPKKGMIKVRLEEL